MKKSLNNDLVRDPPKLEILFQAEADGSTQIVSLLADHSLIVVTLGLLVCRSPLGRRQNRCGRPINRVEGILKCDNEFVNQSYKYRGMQELLYIHGGMTHANQRAYLRWLKTREVTIEKKLAWNDAYLDQSLGRKVQIIRPRMPLQDFAQYEEWKLHFERFLPKLKNDLILVGQSLGGIFLAKYLSENRFPKRIRATYLVCPPYDNSLTKETLAGGFRLQSNLTLLEKQSGRLTLMFSRNDDVVPVQHAEKYRKKLPNTKIIIYKNKNGHFRISRFPEIMRMIKQDIKK